jgi:hypothetical protein
MEARLPDARGSVRRPRATPTDIHEDLVELAFLLGTWSGVGEGVWPPGEPFEYAEDVTFEHLGDPFLVYSQRSWSLDDGSPIHLERGFLRPSGSGAVELVLAHPIGITEVAVGRVEDEVIELRSTAVSVTPTAKPVIELRRRIEARDDRLAYELHMAMEHVALMSHVRSRLERA